MTPSEPLAVSDTDPNPESGSMPTAASSHEQVLRRLTTRLFSQDELPSLLKTIFSNRESTHVVHSLQRGDAQVVVDILDEALDGTSLSPSIRNKCMRSLYKMCARHTLIPTSLRITLCDDPTNIVLFRGGFGDVSKRIYEEQEVAVKTLRTYSTSDLQTIIRRFCKEFVSWKALRHPNVLSLMGVIMTETEFAMVSEWMPNGNINQFVKEHSDANRFELLNDVAKGLIYMHDQGMIHGDLKGANILVDQTCHARLADFGLLTILSDSTTSNSCTEGGTIRWMSPELLDPEIPIHQLTKYSDCYAFGMVIYEVLSRRVPFHQYLGFIVASKVLKGDRPERPGGVERVWFEADDLWELLKQCWAPQPEDRPGIEDVLQCLEKISKSWISPPPQLLATSLAADSLAGGLSDYNTTASTETSAVGSPSQIATSRLPEKLGRDEIVGVIPLNRAERDPTHANDLLTTRDHLKVVISEPDAGLADHCLQDNRDTFPESTAGPGGDFEANCGEDCAAGSAGSKSDTAIEKVADSERLMKGAQAAVNEVESVRKLARILSSERGRESVLGLNRAGAELCIEILDKGLAEHELRAAEKQIFLNTLMKLAGKHSKLPNSMVTTERNGFSFSGKICASGGFADIGQGQCNGYTVAVKTLRVSQMDDLELARKQFCKEVIIWNSLSHPGVLKLVGVLEGVSERRFAMVSEWMANGNIMQYIKKNAVNRLRLLHDAAQGLKYLHEISIVHGCIRGEDILMTNDMPPRACLADFGFTTVVPDPQNQISWSPVLEGGVPVFMAPELLAPYKFGRSDLSPTQEGDVYAFGLTIIQVLTGDYPFQNIKPRELLYHIVCGVRPDKPADAGDIGILDPLWELMENCWHGDKTRRPRIQEVVEGVGDAAANWNTEMPPGDAGEWEEEDPDDLVHAGMFQPYAGEVGSDGTGAGSSHSGGMFGVPSQQSLTGDSTEVVEPVFDHLNLPLPTLRTKKRNGLKRYLDKVFVRDSRP